MNWRDIIKESRKDKDSIYEDDMGFDERRTKTAGGAGFDEDKFGRIQDSDEESLEEHDKLNEADLAEMTRQDLKDTAIEWIETLDEKSLMELLVNSLGKINIDSISYDEHNQPYSPSTNQGPAFRND